MTGQWTLNIKLARAGDSDDHTAAGDSDERRSQQAVGGAWRFTHTAGASDVHRV